ncbi:MAG: MGMT family protein [Gammaproteobacteria bacterium]|nr:MGMT family protein [Gammaproteobacteria bacterium]
MKSPNSYHRVWQIVARIPSGRVATYGQVARLAGLGGHARVVGYALHNTPEQQDLPWHRVINARGEISFPPGSEEHAVQKERLAEEGVAFRGSRIDLAQFRWRPECDGPGWDPGR